MYGLTTNRWITAGCLKTVHGVQAKALGTAQDAPVYTRMAPVFNSVA